VLLLIANSPPKVPKGWSQSPNVMEIGKSTQMKIKRRREIIEQHELANEGIA
jgi:hypothetical protein